jgi:hypothetical protein
MTVFSFDCSNLETRQLCGQNSGANANLIFDMNVAYLRLIICLVIGDVPIDSETLFNRLYESQDQTDSVF